MNTKQIAEEAAEELAIAIGLDPQGSQTGTAVAIIQAAIEKANTELLRRTFPNQHIGDSRAAHASESQKSIMQEYQERFVLHPAYASDDSCRNCCAPLGWFEPGFCDKCRAAQASEERLGCRELAHREYHRGYQDGRKSREAYRTAQTAD